MGMGRTMAGASAIGAVAGGAAGVRHATGVQQWKDSIGGADLHELREGRPLPPIPEPAPITARKQRGIMACYLVGILGTGFVIWLLAFVVLAIVAAAAGAQAYEALGSALLFAFWAGVLGLILGAFVGIGLWLREVRGRLAHDTAIQRRLYWESRENLRGRLASGEWTPEQAWRHLTSGTMGTDADAPPPLPGKTAPESASLPPLAGEPVDPLALIALAAALAGTTGGYRSAEQGADSTPAICAQILTDPDHPAHEHAFLRLSHFNEGAEAQEWAIAAAERGDRWARRAAPYLRQERIDPHDGSAVTMVASVIGAFWRARASGNA